MGKKKKAATDDDGVAVKASREYNLWNSEHEEPFIQCLLELTAKGHIRNGTCKVGVYEEIERMMEEKVPGCGVKAKPMVKNHMKILKQKYNAVAQLRNKSGFGWNSEHNYIDADDHSYDDYVNIHTHCKGWNRTPFPQFFALETVFAKGRATGHIVFTGKDGNTSNTDSDGEEPYTVNLEEMNNAETEEVMVNMINEGVEAKHPNKRKEPPTPSPTTAAPAQKKKKGQADEGSEVAKEMRELRPIIRESAETIARALGESELHCSMRRDLMKNLEELGGLTRSQKVLACRRLNKDLGDLKTFYDMETEEDKMTLVFDLLDP